MSIRILLIEDDRELGKALRNSLSTEGHSVVTAASLSEAKALLANQLAGQTFDLCLLDLGLPDGDGLDWLRVRRGQGFDVPVLMPMPWGPDRPAVVEATLRAVAPGPG